MVIEGEEGNKIESILRGISLFDDLPIKFRFNVMTSDHPMTSQHFITHEIFVD